MDVKSMIVTGSIDEVPLFVNSVKFNMTISVKQTLYFWYSCVSQLDKERMNPVQWLLIN